MSQSNKKSSSEDLMAALMAELNLADGDGESHAENAKKDNDVLELGDSSTEEAPAEELGDESDFGLLDLNFGGNQTAKEESENKDGSFEIKFDEVPSAPEVSLHENPMGQSADSVENLIEEVNSHFKPSEEVHEEAAPVSEVVASSSSDEPVDNSSEKTVAISKTQLTSADYATGDRTVAVAGYSNRSNQNSDDNVKISVGQSGSGSSGYGGWGSTDSNLAQAENLKIAQSKILELEKENEKLRHQNEELVSASEIIKERSDLLTSQVYEYKNDREALESSFKNEMALIKSQLNRKDAELQKAQMKIDELDSRLKFDMKKIRIRERELENRLELIRAEKNALVRSKDEQILESRRKLDQLQLEVDSFRQKCVELNRVIEMNQDSFKRTNRALRLAMANLELQEENKMPLKKVD